MRQIITVLAFCEQFVKNIIGKHSCKYRKRKRPKRDELKLGKISKGNVK